MAISLTETECYLLYRYFQCVVYSFLFNKSHVALGDMPNVFQKHTYITQEAMESFAFPDEFMMKLAKIWTIFKTDRRSIFVKIEKTFS